MGSGTFDFAGLVCSFHDKTDYLFIGTRYSVIRINNKGQEFYPMA